MNYFTDNDIIKLEISNIDDSKAQEAPPEQVLQ